MGIKRLTKLADGKAVTDAPLEEVLNRLAEYEGLDERGRLFRSPCAIGLEIRRISRSPHGINSHTWYASYQLTPALISG